MRLFDTIVMFQNLYKYYLLTYYLYAFYMGLLKYTEILYMVKSTFWESYVKMCDEENGIYSNLPFSTSVL